MFNLFFDRSLGEYLMRYCAIHRIAPQVAIQHQYVLNAAEYYWNAMETGRVDMVDLRIGAGGGQEPWSCFNKTHVQ